MKTEQDETAPINRNELAVALAYELAELTELQACELTGWGKDVVGFRGRIAFIRSEVAKLATGGLPRFARDRQHWDGWPITGD